MKSMAPGSALCAGEMGRMWTIFSDILIFLESCGSLQVSLGFQFPWTVRTFTENFQVWTASHVFDSALLYVTTGEFWKVHNRLIFLGDFTSSLLSLCSVLELLVISSLSAMLWLNFPELWFSMWKMSIAFLLDTSMVWLRKGYVE